MVQSSNRLLDDACRTSGDVLRNFGGRNANGARAVYERLLKLGYGFTIMASVPLIMNNFVAALLPKVAIVFPLEQGAKKGSTIQEQGITTAVLGVQCCQTALPPLQIDMSTLLPCSVPDTVSQERHQTCCPCCKGRACLCRYSAGSSNPRAKCRVHLWAVGFYSVSRYCVHAAGSVVPVAVWPPGTVKAAQSR